MARRSYMGIVISDKMQKTVIVKIVHFAKHPKYSKTTKKYNKFKAHDEKGIAKTGDTVIIEETRPLSKDKRFRVLKVVQKAKTAHLALKEETISDLVYQTELHLEKPDMSHYATYSAKASRVEQATSGQVGLFLFGRIEVWVKRVAGRNCLQRWFIKINGLQSEKISNYEKRNRFTGCRRNSKIILASVC